MAETSSSSVFVPAIPVGPTISNSTSKYDSTFIYNGKEYQEEVFEDHLQDMKVKQKPFASKYQKNKWQNSLSEIREGNCDEEFHINQQNIDQKSRSQAQKGFSELENRKKDELELTVGMTGSRQNSDSRLHQTSHQSSSSSSNIQVEKTEIWTRNIRQEESVTQQSSFKDTNYEGMRRDAARENISNGHSDHISSRESKTRNESNKKLDVKFQEIGILPKPAKYEPIQSKSSQSSSEYIRKDIIIYSDDSDEKDRRRFGDEHYYIGDSEYASVVEDHVQGRYDEDHQYIQGIADEEINVNPKVWTVEEIYKREGIDIEETVTSDYPRAHGSALPSSPLTDHAKEAYIVNWISQERLDLSPKSDKSYPDHEASIDAELDRSDESCIVEVDQMQRKSQKSHNSSNERGANLSNQSRERETESQTLDSSLMHGATSSSRVDLNRSSESILSTDSKYKHISDHIKTKEMMQSQKENIHMTIEQMLTVRETTKPNKIGDQSLFVDANLRDVKSKPIRIQGKNSAREDTERSNKSSDQFLSVNTNIRHTTSTPIKVHENKNSDCKNNRVKEQRHQHSSSKTAIIANSSNSETRTRMYKITQQEIVFYLKNKDGIIKVVRRPLLHSKNNNNSSLNQSWQSR